MVVVATVMVQGLLVGVHCEGVVSGSSKGGFVVVVALEGLGLVSWWRGICHWQSLWNGDLVGIFGFFSFF